MENLRKVSLESHETQQHTFYNDGELAFSLNEVSELHLPAQLEMHAIALVRQGKGMININGNTYEAQKNDIFICPPNTIIQNSLMSIDFKGYFIFVSTAYLQRIMPFAENIWDIKFLFEKNPIYHMKPEEATVFCQYFDLFCSKMHLPQPIQKKVIDTLMLAFMYDMTAALGQSINKPVRPFSAGESIFKRFVEMLETSYPKKRSVSYYAEKLHITPKYLSSICKQISGMRPSDIIDRYVLKNIDYLMKHTNKSIKEIYVELEFPNLSFFGKYVKQHWGMSPKAYREQCVNNMNGNLLKTDNTAAKQDA